ncbi:MAG: hypothetical protein FJX20_17880 [Alphaproteobacteria bacterium]|nr:hypothetical protein [Alphaproteobacteria bacterium]
MRRASGWVIAALCLSACADEAAEQVVTVRSDPPGASCQVTRDNLSVGAVPATPGSIRVTKGTAPLIVACSLSGYETITGGFEARYRGGNLFAARGGGPPAVDPRDYSYADELMITLRR